MDSEAWKQRSWSAKDWAYLVGSESVVIEESRVFDSHD